MFVKFNEVLRYAKGQRETNNYGNVIHAILSGIVSLPVLVSRRVFAMLMPMLVMHGMVQERLCSLISRESNSCIVCSHSDFESSTPTTSH